MRAIVTQKTWDELSEEAREAHLARGGEVRDPEPGLKTYLLCAIVRQGDVEPLPDNVLGPCDGGCGETIRWRPHAKADIRACVFCITAMTEQRQ